MDIEYLERLIALLEANDSLSELEIEESGNRVRLAKFSSNAPAMRTIYAESSPVAAAQNPGQQPAAPVSPAVATAHEVRSPIVGTFYRASSPDAPAFAEVGQHIEKGQPLCIVEAMKLMNEIESDATGTILKVLIENGKPVEYNQPLFQIKLD